jgi:Asp-tRNA(Asn)/Glu-tRNA(Gln) amidotransferase A subunit family amidase
VRTPSWPRAEPVTGEAFAELAATLGDAVGEVEIGAPLERAVAQHRVVMEVEMAHNLRRDLERFGDRLSARLREQLARGRAHSAVEYCAALAAREPLNAALDPVFDEYDALLTPAAPGPAPRGLDSTGDPIFCTPWTYLGTPAVCLPLLAAADGMPIGVQLIGRRGDDARLLRTANWLVGRVAGGRRPRAASPSSNPARGRRTR